MIACFNNVQLLMPTARKSKTGRREGWVRKLAVFLRKLVFSAARTWPMMTDTIPFNT
jgi:hypothetical protein